MSVLNKQKTEPWITKAEIISQDSEQFKTLATKAKDVYGLDIKPQIDILYVRSCLVTAGETHGINDNDDIFTREEAWAARHTPVIKPTNWQHSDKDIVGVIFSVQAKDLNGNTLDFNNDTVPDCEFEFWTEAAIFRLVHPEKSKEIEDRAKANNLFVSMEAWFDDYNYGVYNPDGALEKVYARNNDTAFLDTHLRVRGGSGKYQEKRIGRVLRGITFGGYGFVDRPANKRSIISNTHIAGQSEGGNNEDHVLVLLNKVLEQLKLAEIKTEESLMNASASITPAADPKQLVKEALAEREAEQAKAAAEKALLARSETAEAKSSQLEQQVSELKNALNGKEQESKALKDQLSELDAVVTLLSATEEANAGIVPPEIAAIDAAKDGQAAFKAKLAWISKTVSGLKQRASYASKLEAELAEAAKIVRANEVKNLFAEVVDTEVLDVLITKATELTDEEYEDWKDEKELILLSVQGAESCPSEMPMKNGKKKVLPKDKEAKAENLFKALLEKRRSSGVQTEPNPPLINSPVGPGVNSGVNPGKLRVLKDKVAGSVAGGNPADALETARATKGINLAGASQSGANGSDTGDVASVFKALARKVCGAKENEDEGEAEETRPDFDPVRK